MSDIGAGGLRPEHRGELAAGTDLDVKVRQKRIAELEEDYAEDPLALEQLAFFDPESGYHELMHCYRALTNARRYDACDSLERVFAQHYPLTEALLRQHNEW